MSAIPRSAHFRWTFVAIWLFCGFAWLEGSASAAPPHAVHRLQRTLSGAATFNYFGYSAANAGDVNGDGYDDQIVGAPGEGSLGTDAGRAFVYFGGPGGDAVADLTLTGQGAGDNFGVSVSTAGDFNADGYSDVIVGAPYNDVGGSNSGRAYIYFGGSAPNAIADHIITGANAENQYG